MNRIFSERIIKWYNSNKRDLPWRNIKDPYRIWLSEIILQQTRVEQGLPYYIRYVKEFPTVKHLAAASEEKVLKLWQGLGYYSRARNLHTTAKIIHQKFKGKFPDKYENILQLKGVGEYTAAAIASFSFNLCYPVLDGNVYRVLSRVFGIKTPIDTAAGKNQFNTLAQRLIDKKNPAVYNQAIMEFGAMHCKPQSPDCSDCCLNNMCYAYEKKSVESLPVKSKKIKQRSRFFNYLVIRNNKKLYIKKRTGNDIWKNLYDFPLIETDKLLPEEHLYELREWKNIFKKNKYAVTKICTLHKHVLSHQKIYARFFEVEMNCSLTFPKKGKKILSFLEKKHSAWKAVSESQLEKYAVPRLIDIYLKNRQ